MHTYHLVKCIGLLNNEYQGGFEDKITVNIDKEVDLHQDSALNPSLFAFILDINTKKSYHGLCYLQTTLHCVMEKQKAWI